MSNPQSGRSQPLFSRHCVTCRFFSYASHLCHNENSTMFQERVYPEHRSCPAYHYYSDPLPSGFNSPNINKPDKMSAPVKGSDPRFPSPKPRVSKAKRKLLLFD